MVVPTSFSASGSPQISPQKTDTKLIRVKRSFVAVKSALENVSLKPVGKVFREISDIVIPSLSFAATVVSKKTAKGVSLGVAGIQSFFSLPQIALKIKKSVATYHSLNQIKKKLSDLSEKIALAEKTHDTAQKIAFENQYRFFQRRKNECVSKMTSLLVLPGNLIDLAASAVQLVTIIGSYTRTIAPAVMTSLQLSLAILGAAAGAVTAILGIVSVGFGAKKLKESQAKIVEIKQKEALSQSFTSKVQLPEDLFNDCKKLKVHCSSLEMYTAQKEHTVAILKVCAGSLVTIGGVLAIAASFTMGTAAIVITAVAAAIAITAIGVNIASYVKRRKMKKEILQQKISENDLEKLGKRIAACSIDQQKEIARFFECSREDEENFCKAPVQMLQKLFSNVLKEEPKL